MTTQETGLGPTEKQDTMSNKLILKLDRMLAVSCTQEKCMEFLRLLPAPHSLVLEPSIGGIKITMEELLRDLPWSMLYLDSWSCVLPSGGLLRIQLADLESGLVRLHLSFNRGSTATLTPNGPVFGEDLMQIFLDHLSNPRECVSKAVGYSDWVEAQRRLKSYEASPQKVLPEHFS